MRRIPCEGSGCRGHRFGPVYMCAMCGEMVASHDGVADDHDRDDILKAIDDGEFG